MKRIFNIILTIVFIIIIVNVSCSNRSKENIMVRQFVNSEYFSCSLYILSSEKGNLLIDPGYYDNEIKDYIESVGGLDAIIMTHGHLDHIMGLDLIKKDYPDVKVYINRLEKDFLYNPGLNCSKWNGFDLIMETRDISLFDEGETTIGGYDIEIIHTPGHTKGSSIIWFKDENLLFTGDFILEEDIGRTDLPTASESDMENSIGKFREIRFPDDMKVYFGHGDDYFTYKELMERNEYLR